jgi:hypothetical protein
MRARKAIAPGSVVNGRHARVSRTYDARFRPTAAYRTSLPDIVDAPGGGIKGSHVPIQQVGVSNFKLPLKFRTKKGGVLTLETSVTGTVSLATTTRTTSSRASGWDGSSGPTCAT